RLSATTILAFFAVTVLVGTVFAVASLYSKRRAWSLDNELRAASGRPDRRHWMPPLLVGLVWLMGGSIAQFGVLLLVASMNAGERSPETTTDDLGATVAIVFMAAVMVIAAGAAGTQKWRLHREDSRLQVSDRMLAQRGHGGGRG
ncbi:putative membrane protein, partial [Rhodococcus opacus M213]